MSTFRICARNVINILQCSRSQINISNSYNQYFHKSALYFLPLNKGNNFLDSLEQRYTTTRNYAKGKDKKKEKGKKKVEINEHQLNEIMNLTNLKLHMQKCVDTLKQEYIKNLSLRSAAGSIESIPVNFEEKDYVLQELAQVVRKNPNTVIINMMNFPQAIPSVIKAIEKSGMNLNPQQDGTTLFIPVPKVTKEHRENLAKNAKMLFTKCKEHIRDIQNKQTKSVKKQTTLSEDLVFSIQEQVTAIADQFIAEAETILITKQNELLGKS